MLTLPRMQEIALTRRPTGQDWVARMVLAPNFGALPGVQIRFDGVERVPDRPVIFAMNHTDRYQSFPFQYAWRQRGRYAAVWVKGKYYQRRWMAAFLQKTNQIPTVSRGYVIAADVLQTLGRKPTDEEYRALRALVEATALDQQAPTQVPHTIPPQFFTQARDIMGRAFDPSRESWAAAVVEVFRAFMRAFVGLNESAHRLGLDLLIFPEGTRASRLGRGHIGLAQMAIYLDCPIVPVGCNGSDLLYPGGFPLARRGEVLYRFGAPIPVETVRSFAPVGGFSPFLAADEARHRARFQGLTDVVMDAIEQQLDARYRRAPVDTSFVRGADRFV